MSLGSRSSSSSTSSRVATGSTDGASRASSSTDRDRAAGIDDRLTHEHPVADPQPASDPTPPAPTEAAPLGPGPAEQVATGEVLDPAVQDEVSIARRRFFRQFAGELIQTAATVAGAAQALQRASAEAAGAILDPASVALLGGEAPPAPAGPPTGFRTPFREADGMLLVIDQRRLPDELVEVEVRNGPEAANAIRQMVVRGAPAIGQVAAIGMALSAERARETLPYARRAIIRGAAAALRASR